MAERHSRVCQRPKCEPHLRKEGGDSFYRTFQNPSKTGGLTSTACRKASRGYAGPEASDVRESASGTPYDSDTGGMRGSNSRPTRASPLTQTAVGRSTHAKPQDPGHGACFPPGTGGKLLRGSEGTPYARADRCHRVGGA